MLNILDVQGLIFGCLYTESHNLKRVVLLFCATQYKQEFTVITTKNFSFHCVRIVLQMHILLALVYKMTDHPYLKHCNFRRGKYFNTMSMLKNFHKYIIGKASPLDMLNFKKP